MTAELLTIDMFADKVGESFAIEEAEIPAVALILTAVTPLHNFANAERAPFSLLFETHGVGILPQRSYELRHPGLALHPVFLVPIARDGDTVSYQAIFN